VVVVSTTAVFSGVAFGAGGLPQQVEAKANMAEATAAPQVAEAPQGRD